VTEPLTLSRPARLAYAVVITGFAAAILASIIGFTAYHLGLWLLTASVSQGTIVIMKDLPGPFTGWLSHALWDWLIISAVMLPKQVVKALRDKHYPQSNRGRSNV
jgi:hypothetical protein